MRIGTTSRSWFCLTVAVVTIAMVDFVFSHPTAAEGLTNKEIALIEAAVPKTATVQPTRPRNVLIFCRAEGYYHTAIPYASKALELMGRKTGAYASVTSTDMSQFHPDRLKQFDAVIFNNTTQLSFDEPNRRRALVDFVHNGGGMVGIHAGADNFNDFPEAAAMMGGVFVSHPWYVCPVKIDDPTHPLVRAFNGKAFWIRDEIYKFGGPYSRKHLRVLLSMDAEKGDPRHLGRKDRDNAVAWIQNVGDGRVFYCSLGHEHVAYWTPLLLQFYLDGIQFALGDLKADATPSAELDPQPTPILPSPRRK